MVASLVKSKSKSYRNKNLQWIQQRSPQMTGYLRSATPGISVSAAKTRSNQASLLYRQNNRQVCLHSLYNPAEEARTWAEHVGKEEWQIGVIFGAGLGYHLEELQRLYPERSLVLIEPLPDVLNVALQLRDFRSIFRHPRFSIVVSSDPLSAAISLFEQHIRSGVINGEIAFLCWPPYQRLWGEYWQELQKETGNLMRQTALNISTYRYFSMQWQENLFTNVRAAVADPSVKSLFPLFKNKPAILVSAGPSLQKNIHLLAEAKDRALIVAAGSAIGPLLAHGIKPHLVISFDGAAANYYVFRAVDTTDLVLVYSSVIYPRIIAEYQGPRFALGVDIYPFERWFYEKMGQDRGSVASGPSIANLTWDLLRQMDCDPIIFVGQDLAFSPEGQSHAAGRVELDYEFKKPSADPNDAAVNNNFEWVEDIWGNQVRTRSVWLGMKIWFEQRIKRWGNGRTFIDATEGGAKIAGTQIMSLQEALDAHCSVSFDPEGLIRDAHASGTAQLSMLDMNAKLERALSKISDEIDKMLNVCNEALDPLRALDELNRSAKLTEQDFAKFHTLFSRLDVQVSSMDVYKHFIRPAIDNSIAAFSAMSVRLKAEKDLTKKGQQLAELYASMFAVVRKTVLELQSHVQRTVEMSTPYSPPALVLELDFISSVCDEMQLLIGRMEELSQMSIDESVWAEVQATQEKLVQQAAQINQTETLRWFVKEIVEQDAVALNAVQAKLNAANEATDPNQKARLLAEYHGQSVHLVKTSLTQIRLYCHLST